MEIHHYMEVRDKAVCDFCCIKDAVYYYPLEGERRHEIGNMVSVEHGGWCACEECSIIVDTKDIVKVAKHVAQNPPTTLIELGMTTGMIVYALIQTYEEIIPLLGPKTKETPPIDGSVFTASGDKELIDSVREARSELIERQTSGDREEQPGS